MNFMFYASLEILLIIGFVMSTFQWYFSYLFLDGDYQEPSFLPTNSHSNSTCDVPKKEQNDTSIPITMSTAMARKTCGIPSRNFEILQDLLYQGFHPHFYQYRRPDSTYIPGM